ncbi:hypothetical protein [Pedobacter nyackensis]|uniref:hypothetical protein n=1 Tax=Pedobacter nyackensis TaxID=475255 RepID=UPI00292DC800|nr:hypothetical protein [Pedobacter nyackensis]
MNNNNNIQITADLEVAVNAFFCDTPMRVESFELDDDDKIELIQKPFTAIMATLGLDLSDDRRNK